MTDRVKSNVGMNRHAGDRYRDMEIGSMGFYDDLDDAEIDNLTRAINTDIEREVRRAIPDDLAERENELFMGASARGRSEFFDGQHRIKLVD